MQNSRPPHAAAGRRTFLKSALLSAGAAGFWGSSLAQPSADPVRAARSSDAPNGGTHALLEAVRQGDADAVREMLTREPLLRTLRDEQDRSLSWIAHAAGHPELQPLLSSASDARDIFALASIGNAATIVSLARTDVTSNF